GSLDEELILGESFVAHVGERDGRRLGSYGRQLQARAVGDEQIRELAAELVLREMAEEGCRDPEARQRSCRVEGATTRGGALRPVAVVDHVDQRLAADDDHGGISPEPRAIMRDFTVCTWEGERSPSRRRKRTPAAVRPIAAGS